MTARLTLRLLLFAIVAFVAGLVAARWLLDRGPVPPPETENATVFDVPRPLPALDLVDQDGRPFTADSMRGHWSVVFFGFTHCPDVCPTTLAVLKQVRKQLEDVPEAERPRVVLFTVDPERDTVDRLREYVRFFDPSFGGVTGTVEAVQQAATGFAVPFAKVPLPQGGYTMDHGAGIFFVAPDGTVAAYSSPPLDAGTLARDFRKLRAYHEAARG
jgi:protein SCO1/2